MRNLLSMFLILPLAACFNADISMTFIDNETARMNAIMTMAPELYAMVQQSGDDPCEDGVGELQDDGSFTCTIVETDTIDNLIAQAAPGDSNSPTAVAEGYAIERLDGDKVRVSFDLSDMLDGAGPTEDLGDMEAVLRESFAGHQITMRVTGKEIVETNGEVSEDGKTASFVIPLLVLLEEEPDIPASFDVVVRTP